MSWLLTPLSVAVNTPSPGCDPLFHGCDPHFCGPVASMFQGPNRKGGKCDVVGADGLYDTEAFLMLDDVLEEAGDIDLEDEDEAGETMNM